MSPSVIYVNAYSVSRCYGGPEEGGWWYDAGVPIASVPLLSPISTEPCDKCGAPHDQVRHGGYHAPGCKVLAGEAIGGCNCPDLPPCDIAVAQYAEYDRIVEAEKQRLTELLGWEKQDAYGRPSRLGRYSVIGGDDFEISVEDEPAKAYPEVRPHYE